MKQALPRMISKGEKEKQRKKLNKFSEQNVQGTNKIGVAASGRHVHKKGQFCLFLEHCVQ